MVRVIGLSVRLLKERVRTWEAALRDPESLVRSALAANMPYEGAFFLQPQFGRAPSWATFLGPAVTADLSGLRSQSTAAVLFLEATNRRFAFTFGYGHLLLRDDSYETDFGLKVVLNTVDADRVRSVDVRTFEDLTIDTRRQTSRTSPVEAFGLDVTRDLLRAVAGVPQDSTFARHVQGADSLHLRLRVQPHQLGEKCTDLFNAYESDAYKQRFGWIDHLSRVRDPLMVETLDELMVRAIREGIASDTHLAAPEVLEWGMVGGFRYSGQKETLAVDLDLEDYLASTDNASGLSVEQLRKDRVELLSSEDDRVLRRWPVYECIVFELDHEGVRYALTTGQWFRIASDFVDEVEKHSEGISQTTLSLPDAFDDESELDYNRRLSEAVGESAVLDGVLVRLAPGLAPIEVCDVLVASRTFVHVKKKTRSSTLSHLFAQGYVSAEAFLGEASFRRELRDRVAQVSAELADRLPEDRPTTSKFEVTYVVIAPPPVRGELRPLPFFSKVNLMIATRHLRTLGFNVSLGRVNSIPRPKSEALSA